MRTLFRGNGFVPAAAAADVRAGPLASRMNGALWQHARAALFSGTACLLCAPGSGSRPPLDSEEITVLTGADLRLSALRLFGPPLRCAPLSGGNGCVMRGSIGLAHLSARFNHPFLKWIPVLTSEGPDQCVAAEKVRCLCAPNDGVLEGGPLKGFLPRNSAGLRGRRAPALRQQKSFSIKSRVLFFNLYLSAFVRSVTPRADAS